MHAYPPLGPTLFGQVRIKNGKLRIQHNLFKTVLNRCAVSSLFLTLLALFNIASIYNNLQCSAICKKKSALRRIVGQMQSTIVD